MDTLLRIDCSLRAGGSYSRRLADRFETCWREAHPGGRRIARDLGVEPVPHLDAASHPRLKEAGGISDRLIDELEAADGLLIACPVYNFGIPSSLKAWFDHVVRPGRTVTVTPQGYAGLMTGKEAIVMLAQGAEEPAGAEGPVAAHLRALLAFIGIDAVEVVGLDGTAGPAEDAARRLEEALERVDRIRSSPAWLGDFTAEDRRQIDALRDGQARAIEAGDAAAYAGLCAGDVRLMLPGSDLVAGVGALRAAETLMFAATTFTSFRKTPERIRRSGDLAVETGRQDVGTGRGTSRQKYLHVMRRTPEGWRFTVLMSNASE